jgi:hypothetical protein
LRLTIALAWVRALVHAASRLDSVARAIRTTF